MTNTYIWERGVSNVGLNGTHSIMGGNWRHLRSKYGMEECNVMKSCDEKCKNECESVSEQINEMCSWRDRCDMTLFNKEECSTILLNFHVQFKKIKKCCFKYACIVRIRNYKQTLEDEEYFPFHCNFYYSEHQDFYYYIKNIIPNFNNLSIEQKLQTVMTKEYLKIFSKYLWKMYQMRQNKA